MGGRLRAWPILLSAADGGTHTVGITVFDTHAHQSISKLVIAAHQHIDYKRLLELSTIVIMTSKINFLVNVIMLIFLSLLMLRVKAQNSSVPSLKRAIDSLIHKVQKRVVFGNASDPIAITELPGYTGWVLSKKSEIVQLRSTLH
jgi:hypothetical protein